MNMYSVIFIALSFETKRSDDKWMKLISDSLHGSFSLNLSSCNFIWRKPSFLTSTHQLIGKFAFFSDEECEANKHIKIIDTYFLSQFWKQQLGSSRYFFFFILQANSHLADLPFHFDHVVQNKMGQNCDCSFTNIYRTVSKTIIKEMDFEFSRQ